MIKGKILTWAYKAPCILASFLFSSLIWAFISCYSMLQPHQLSFMFPSTTCSLHMLFPSLSMLFSITSSLFFLTQNFPFGFSRITISLAFHHSSYHIYNSFTCIYDGSLSCYFAAFIKIIILHLH